MICTAKNVYVCQEAACRNIPKYPCLALMPEFLWPFAIPLIGLPPCKAGPRTDFLIEAALEKAEGLIAEQTLIRLPPRDQELLIKALAEENVSEPSRFLKSLTREYGERVTQA